MSLALAVNNSVICIIEKLDGWGGVSEGFCNYLLQQNKIIHDIFAINQVQQLVLDTMTKPRC